MEPALRHSAWQPVFLKHFLFCSFSDEFGRILTFIGHDSEAQITVNGYDPPGSYVRSINYATNNMEALEEVIERAQTCRQYIEYKCNNSRLLQPICKFTFFILYYLSFKDFVILFAL